MHAGYSNITLSMKSLCSDSDNFINDYVIDIQIYLARNGNNKSSGCPNTYLRLDTSMKHTQLLGPFTVRRQKSVKNNHPFSFGAETKV